MLCLEHREAMRASRRARELSLLKGCFALVSSQSCGLIWGCDVGDRAEVESWGGGRGSCSLKCTFGWCVGDCSVCNQDEILGDPETEWRKGELVGRWCASGRPGGLCRKRRGRLGEEAAESIRRRRVEMLD